MCVALLLEGGGNPTKGYTKKAGATALALFVLGILGQWAAAIPDRWGAAADGKNA